MLQSFKKGKIMPSCDTKTRFCETSPLKELSALSLNYTKPTILYIGDPMCSWCYGIAPELEKLQIYAKEKDIGYKIMLGGLRPYGQEWNSEFKGFLAHHWKEVNARTNQKFDYAFLEREDFSYSTLPSCKAVVVMRHLLDENSDKMLSSYFSDIQVAFFAKNQDPTDINLLAKLAQKYGISEEVFIKIYNDKKAHDITFAEFSQVQNLGVRGFPSLILYKDDKLMQISNGYATNLSKRVENLMKS